MEQDSLFSPTAHLYLNKLIESETALLYPYHLVLLTVHFHNLGWQVYERIKRRFIARNRKIKSLVNTCQTHLRP